jgi:hypothetical protein
MRRTIRYQTLCLLLYAAGCAACATRSSDSPKPAQALPNRAPTIARGAFFDGSREPIQFVVMVSVDGLAQRFIQPLVDAGRLPTFGKLQQGGASTFQARTDTFNTSTLPNHTSMLTGLPVERPRGFPDDAFHGLTLNVMPPPFGTLHNLGNRAAGYIPSAFDVAHDFGLKTCFFAGKHKFVIYVRSYDEEHGRPDTIGADNGRAKIDVAVINPDSDALISKLEETPAEAPCQMTFVHLPDMDAVGHLSGWGSPLWTERLEQIDGLLGRIVDHIEKNPKTAGKTALIVTADHGGVGVNHNNPRLKEDFAIPFYVVAPGIPRGKDLYTLVPKTRAPPGNGNPDYTAPHQPIRNGDLGNLALDALALPPIPGSLMFGMGLFK